MLLAKKDNKIGGREIMKKRMLSILLMVCMVLTMLPTMALADTVTNYGIWVGPTEVTSENMGGVTGDGIDGTVTYDPLINILTLNNASTTTMKGFSDDFYKDAITRLSSDTRELNINLIGTNIINLSTVNSGSVTGISAEGKVNIQSTTDGSLSVISTLAIPDSISFIAGHNYTVSDLDSYKPTITPNGATITAEGWQQCVEIGTVYSSGWSDWSAGVLSPDTGSTYKLRYYATSSDGRVYSNEVTLNVVGNTTSLVLTANPENQQTAGNSVTLTATLTGFFLGPGVSGQAIIFKNGGVPCGNADLNAAGVAVFSWTPHGTGTYSLTAGYYGSLYNTAATSAAVDYTVGATAPILTAGAVTRTNDTTATVKFTSNEVGSYYYAVVADGAAVPSIETSGAGTACTTEETTITNPVGLTAGAKDIYILVKDAAGNLSPNTFKIDIPAAFPDIRVGGIHVTSANAGNVTGDGITGTVTYDPNERILTLNNATITKMGNNMNAIYSGTNLKIVLIGNNTIRIWSGSSSNSNLAGINVNGELKIESTSDGSISVYNTLGAIENYGIKATSGITIEGCTVNAAGWAASRTSAGIVVTDGNLYIRNATVTADSSLYTLKGSSYGIYIIKGSLDIDNSSTVTATGDERALLVAKPTETVLTETALVAASTSKSFVEADAITLDELKSDNSYKYIKITPQYVQGHTGIPVKGEFTLNTTGVNGIYNADQLAYVAKQVNEGVAGWNSASYKIMNDIDLSCYTNWSPIGKVVYLPNYSTGPERPREHMDNNNSKPFTGTFDGNGKKSQVLQ
jgi:hypothetical protein